MKIICGIELVMLGGRNGKSNLPRRIIRNCMKKEIIWKVECAKSHIKAVRDKRMKILTEEGAVSFWRLGLKRRKV